MRRALGTAFLTALTLAAASVSQAKGLYPLGETEGVSRLSDKPIPFRSVEQLPARPPLLLELGDAFLGTGPLSPGFELPTGAVWQPRLWVFATHRSAVESFDNGVSERRTEWANRLDLFANLQLSGTEKAVLGIRPLDKNRFGQFSGYNFESDNRDGGRSEFNSNVRTLFFEGDLGSLLPALDPAGVKALDFGFSVGRQPLIFQEGIQINDTVDMLGLVHNNIRLPGVSNLRIAGVWGWNELDRNDNRNDRDADMFGLFLAADMPHRTVNLDAILVEDDIPNRDAFLIGASTVERFGHLNTTFRINASFAEDSDTAQVSDGVLLSAELSWTPKASNDIVYINPFWAIDTYTQAGREPIVGGPLATFGILFASSNIGDFRSELSARANEVAGAAIGYQAFWDQFRRNLVLELAGRKDTSGNGFDSAALGFQLQQKFGRRVLLQIEGFVAAQESRDDAFGGRTEVLIQF